MRACFLGQSVCALGYGVAMLQTPPLNEPDDCQPSGPRPAYPVVMPSDGQEYGRPSHYPLPGSPPRVWKADPRL